jgi:Flp pilus assembly protein TadG
MSRQAASLRFARNDAIRGGLRATQRGAYAVEFAIVFLLFFGLIYTTICYGVTLTMRMGLQHAAEDGARAALRYHKAADSAAQLSLRRAKAAEVSSAQVSGWFATAPVVVAEICQSATANCTTPNCGPDWDRRCQVLVTVTARGLNRMFPLIHFAMPDTITGQASMLLDGRSQ